MSALWIFNFLLHLNWGGKATNKTAITEEGRTHCAGFVTCQTEDLQRGRGGQDYLKSTLETLAQLHGTGLHYKRAQGGREGVLERFPKIEEQIQIQVMVRCYRKDVLRIY